jgi:hypothetical protein
MKDVVAVMLGKTLPGRKSYYLIATSSTPQTSDEEEEEGVCHDNPVLARRGRGFQPGSSLAASLLSFSTVLPPLFLFRQAGVQGSC